MIKTTILGFIVLILLIGGIFLQIFLSKRKSKWFGLILPSITFLYSLLIVMSIVVLVGMTGGEIFMLIATTFIISNIPSTLTTLNQLMTNMDIKREI
ncbi:MAG: hypothetical protein K0R21_563 [Anaerocolumna sp.]|jgi:hypothetical protein|nr:hypothetical protein [Anaerocolumna sp.]